MVTPHTLSLSRIYIKAAHVARMGAGPTDRARLKLMRDPWNSRHFRNPKIRLLVLPWQRGAHIGYHAPPSHARTVEIGQRFEIRSLLVCCRSRLLQGWRR